MYLLEKQLEKKKEKSETGYSDYDGEENLAYHFYVSRVPCGDATIRPMSDEIEYVCRDKKRKLNNNDDKDDAIEDHFVKIHRTGARPINKSLDHTETGIIRLKPGRNDHFSSHSHSCSDKLAKWCTLGFQGSFLAQFIKTPLKFDTLTIHSCDNVSGTLESCKRTISRFQKNETVKIDILDSNKWDLIKNPWLDSIEFSRDSEADSVVWYKTLKKPEKYTRGYLAGCSKKIKGSPKSGGTICRYWMKDLFVRILKQKLKIDLSETTYEFLKKGADEYSRDKNKLKKKFGWNDRHDSKFDIF